MTKASWWFVVATFALLAGIGWITPQSPAQGKGGKQPPPGKTEEKTEEKPKPPPTVKAEKKSFRIELQVKGTLEAADMAEIVFRTQPISGISPPPLVIERIAEHGISVKAGDKVVVFNQVRLDQMLRELETEKKLLDGNILLAAQEQPLLEKAVAHDLETALREQKQTNEDLKYFMDVAKGEMIKRLNFQLKSYAEYYEQAKEELRQLEKMYKANDLTEETEQIILRRYRRYLESADFMYKSAKLEHEHAMKVEIPRREIAVKEAALRADMYAEKVSKTHAAATGQKKLALERLHFERSKLEDRISKLSVERAGMAITAPFDGVVYHGRFHKGQWSGMSDRLVPRASVQPDEPFMTIVKAGALRMRVSVDEKDAADLRNGAVGKARFVFAPEVKLDAKVARIAPLPASPGKFEALVDILDATSASVLAPGMACSVKFVPYAKKDAVTVPASAVSEEDDKHVVYLPDAKGKPKMREVTVGRTQDGVTEILKGLEAGDEILQDRPRATGSATASGKEE